MSRFTDQLREDAQQRDQAAQALYVAWQAAPRGSEERASFSQQYEDAKHDAFNLRFQANDMEWRASQ